MTLRKQFLPDTTYEFTEIVTTCTNPAHVKPDRIPALRKASECKVSPLTKKVFATDTCWEMEDQSSPMEKSSPMGISTTFQGKPNTNTIHDFAYFVDWFGILCLTGLWGGFF